MKFLYPLLGLLLLSNICFGQDATYTFLVNSGYDFTMKTDGQYCPHEDSKIIVSVPKGKHYVDFVFFDGTINRHYSDSVNTYEKGKEIKTRTYEIAENKHGENYLKILETQYRNERDEIIDRPKICTQLNFGQITIFNKSDNTIEIYNTYPLQFLTSIRWSNSRTISLAEGNYQLQVYHPHYGLRGRNRHEPGKTFQVKINKCDSTSQVIY